MLNIIKHKHVQIVVITFISIVAAILYFSYALIEGGTTLINVSLALGFAYVYLKGRKFYFATLLPFIVLQVLIRIFWFEFNAIESVVVSVLLTLLLLLQIEIGYRLVDNFRLEISLETFSFELIVKIVSVLIIVALTGSILGFMIFSLAGFTYFHGGLHMLFHFTGDLIGMLIFLPVLVFSDKYDSGYFSFFTTKRKIGAIFFVVFYVLLNLFLLLYDSMFSYYNHLYLLSAFFLVAALFYSYRLIAFLSFMLLVLSRSSVIFDSEIQLIYVTDRLSVGIFLLVSVLLAFTIKRFIDINAKQSQALDITNQELDELVDYVHELLLLSKDILTDKSKKNHTEFIERTYTITSQLFSKETSPFLVIEDHGKLSLSGGDYDSLESIPFLYESYDYLEEVKRTAVFIDDFKTFIKTRYKTTILRNEVIDSHSITMRTLLRITLSPDVALLIGHDTHKESNLINDSLRDRLRKFTTLMNQVFKKHYLTQHHNTLKNDIILAMVRTIDLYDTYTKGHSEDVAYFSKMMAEKLHLDKSMVEKVYWAGILHDIGKLGIPSAIINKPDRLTKAEYTKVKEHVALGYNTIKDSEDLSEIASMMLHHHEWWNGDGYPNNLKGSDISLGGQILAVADCVATMGTDRPYRKHQSKKIIKEELLRMKSIQFAPAAVDAMVSLLDRDILSSHYSHYKKNEAT